MRLVLDTSVAMTWCYDDEITDQTVAIRGTVRAGGALVPAIWPSEVANALRSGERRRRLTAVDTALFLRVLQALPIVVDPPQLTTTWGPVLILTREHNLSAYDASYLELAMRAGLPLATLDTRLRHAAEQVGVPLV